jgi:hypothetical protein
VKFPALNHIQDQFGSCFPFIFACCLDLPWGGVQIDPSASSCVCVQSPDFILFGLLGSDNISICV